jgi:hypothetical protein
LKDSRFGETRARDRARSALRGVGRSQLRQREAFQSLNTENLAGSGSLPHSFPPARRG